MFAQLQPHEPFIEGIKLTLKNKPFWIFMIPAFFLAIVLPMFQTGLLYYVEHTIGGLDLILWLLFIIIGIVIGMVFNVSKMPQIGPKKIMIINLSLITLAFMVLFLMGQNTLLAWIPGFFAGIGFAGAMVSNGVLMGDNIDNDELITGKRREAVYGGVNAIVTKPSLSIASRDPPELLSKAGHPQRLSVYFLNFLLPRATVNHLNQSHPHHKARSPSPKRSPVP